MSRLFFDYRMEFKYSNCIPRCHFTIKCIPTDTLRQRISDIQMEIAPDTAYSESRDSFGNGYIYGCVDSPHDKFLFHISGVAETRDFYEGEADARSMMYGHPYGLNLAGDEIRKYFMSFSDELSGSAYEKSIFIMHRLNADFTYETGSTDLHTPAEQAWRQRRGVCQDYAHIMIALCQLSGISARYVCGLMIGEGQSHAWVEILHEGKWYAMDPTHDVIVGEKYIKLGCGRDASDCQINRGILCGDIGSQTQMISANVREI